ncbi:hypothetical protein [Mycobacterium sp.]|uniref:hypothetical protein n=1 Tax=Mycobacterium sp. TaxID=1785 RepID=UPI0025EEFEB6|nr:hypothetical protein [Mycobacterium sp.]
MHSTHLAASGLITAGLGLISLMGASPAQASPAPPPAAHSVTCPGGRDVRYLPDPKDANAYFVCRDGVQTQHIACPPIAKLIFTTPPRCAPQSNHHMA